MSENQDLMPVALCVDVEDGVNIAMRDVFGRDMAPTDRVVRNTEQILELFAEYEVTGTFFVLGQIAEHYPQLVRKIYADGHELGIHGYDHLRFNRMNRDTAREQLKRAKSLIEELIGEEVKGHRAPAFSIDASTQWGLPLLEELGFSYDSSIMPCRAPHYGWEEFPKDITEMHFQNGKSIYEVPMSTITFGFKERPCLGGSYFRLLPYWVTSYAIRKVGKTRNPIFYMHPYEMDTQRYPDFYFDALGSESLKVQLKMRSMWLRRGSVKDKIEKMISQFSTDTMASILERSVRNNGIQKKELTV